MYMYVYIYIKPKPLVVKPPDPEKKALDHRPWRKTLSALC